MKTTLAQLTYELQNDFNRFPLPICFDSYEERKELYGRKCMIETIAQRFLSIKAIRDARNSKIES